MYPLPIYPQLLTVQPRDVLLTITAFASPTGISNFPNSEDEGESDSIQSTLDEEAQTITREDTLIEKTDHDRDAPTDRPKMHRSINLVSDDEGIVEEELPKPEKYETTLPKTLRRPTLREIYCMLHALATTLEGIAQSPNQRVMLAELCRLDIAPVLEKVRATGIGSLLSTLEEMDRLICGACAIGQPHGLRALVFSLQTKVYESSVPLRNLIISS